MRGLYAIVDPDQCTGPTIEPLELAAAILRGGCAALQLRAKSLNDDEFLDLARPMAKLCEQYFVPFFVNDRVHLVAPAGALGVHLGQHDMDVRKARALLGNRLIGLSTHNLNQVRKAAAMGVDLIGFGPVYPTSTKQDPDAVVGLAKLRQTCQRSPVPVAAIGGITQENAAYVAATGAAMIAMVSALAHSEHPEGTARCVHELCGGEAGVAPSASIH